MGIKERKDREKEQLKIKMLEAAIDIINEDGHQALTIRRLASRIEYSPRTIYLYYRDKEELLRAIIEHGFGFSVKNLEANNFYSGYSAEEHLKSTITNHLKMAAGNVNYYNSITHVVREAGFTPGPNQSKFESYIADSLTPLINKCGSDTELTISFLFSSLRGITLEIINKRPPENEERLDYIIDKIFDFYSNLLNK